MKLRPSELIVAGIAFAAVLVAVLFAFDGVFAAVPAGKNGAAAAVPVEVPAEGVPAEAVPAFPSLPEEIADPFPEFAAPENGISAAPAAPLPLSPVPAKSAAKAPPRAAKNFSCAGQICIDADTGETLSARGEYVRHPPASVTKLMTIFLVLDAADAGTLSLKSPVTASRRAQETGGTQVYLAAGEVCTVEELLYALMLQSANDAAVALAEKVGGSVEEFVVQMNRKARELGLSRTKFSTPHGLPVSKAERAAGRQPDMTCAADLAKLSRALILAHPEVFRYAAAKTKNFRDGRLGVAPLPMKNHNTLLWDFPGCDGLKTGWVNAGASIVTTASRGGRRVVAVVLGGIVPAAKGGPDARASQRERNRRAAELMFDGLKKIDALKYEPTPNVP